MWDLFYFYFSEPPNLQNVWLHPCCLHLYHCTGNYCTIMALLRKSNAAASLVAELHQQCRVQGDYARYSNNKKVVHTVGDFSGVEAISMSMPSKLSVTELLSGSLSPG